MNRTKMTIPTTDQKDKIFAGFDNGVSGTIGIIGKHFNLFFEVPVKMEQSYTKKKANISRIIVPQLIDIFTPYTNLDVMCMVERPMVNSQRFNASASALRALEATLIVLEYFNFSYCYIDSKEWQKKLLPIGSKGDQLKVDSKNMGCRLFPQHSKSIISHGDADGILIAEYCRLKYSFL